MWCIMGIVGSDYCVIPSVMLAYLLILIWTFIGWLNPQNIFITNKEKSTKLDICSSVAMLLLAG